MAKLIYAAIASLDGYIEDAEGKFDWAAPDEEVHVLVSRVELEIVRVTDTPEVTHIHYRVRR